MKPDDSLWTTEDKKQLTLSPSDHMETFISLDHAILTKHLKHCWVALIQLRATSHQITTKQSLVATKLSSTALSISHFWDLTRHCFRVPTTFSGKMQSLKRHISQIRTRLYKRSGNVDSYGCKCIWIQHKKGQNDYINDEKITMIIALKHQYNKQGLEEQHCLMLQEINQNQHASCTNKSYHHNFV